MTLSTEPSVAPAPHSSSPPGEATSAVLIDVLRATVKVDGLSTDEAEILLHTWSRCNARPLAAASPERALPTLARNDAVSWTQFHENLVSWITLRAIESGRGDLMMFHAAALSSPDSGAAIVLVAESGTGKTTATRNLAKKFGYITDETAAFDTHRRLLSYAKPLSLLPASNRRPKTQYSPEELGLEIPSTEPYVAALAVLDRNRTGAKTEPSAEKLPLAEALTLVIPQMSSLAFLQRGLIGLCQHIDALGGVVRLNYSEAADLPDIVDGLLSGSPTPSSGNWRVLPLELLGGSLGPTGTYRRTPVNDAIEVDSDVAILKDEQFFMLSGLGPALWEALSGWKSFDELLEDMAAVHGRPPGAEDYLSCQLVELVGQGIIEQS